MINVSILVNFSFKSWAKCAWNKLANKPEANSIYKFDNGYAYKADPNGRVSNVEANLKLEANDRNKYQQTNSGKNNGRLPDDHGGHLIASMFKGPGEGINIVPMDKGEYLYMSSNPKIFYTIKKLIGFLLGLIYLFLFFMLY